MFEIVYFSNVSENTKRFVDKLGVKHNRIPVMASEAPLMMSEPYVLIVPTYGGGDDATSVPKQVIRFLNQQQNRDLIRGVIASGNTNFCDKYCRAGEIVAMKCQVPRSHRF
ncbi:MAG: class Ib ribonucleoside-diphosphate reductase assembly flavoprotein NrdI, partial [Rhodoluna sp.]